MMMSDNPSHSSAGDCLAQFEWKPREPEVRSRRKHNKSFNGCLPCKRRRIRCDEVKPSCGRCLQTKTTCEYKPLQVWIFKGTEEGKAKPQPKLSLPPTDNSVTLSSRRALSYYGERAAPIFAGYFGKDFFNSLVIRMSHDEPIIRDILAGAGTLLESLQTEDQARGALLKADFLKSYNKSITALTLKSPPTQVVLASCALFACYDMVQGSIGQGISHVRAGINIVESRLKWLESHGQYNSREAVFLREHLQPIMAGFAIQAYIYGTNLLPIKKIPEMCAEHYELPDVPATFSSIALAHHCLSGIIHQMAIAKTETADLIDPQYVTILGQLLGEWNISLNKYERGLVISQLKAQKVAITILWCNCKMASAVLKTLEIDFATSDSGQDIFQQDFGDILRIYREMGTAVFQGDASVESTAQLLVVEALPPLFIIALTTADKTHQAEAIAILGSMDHKEANWHSKDATNAARYVLQKRISKEQDVYLPVGTRGRNMRPSICMHTASVQWSLSHCIPKIRDDDAIRSLFDGCICRQDGSVSSSSRPP